MSYGFDKITLPDIDVQTRAQSRMLIQFKDSPVIQQVLYALISEIQVLVESIKDTMELRSPAQANGVNEDIIGRIVGQERTIFDYSLINWFAPDGSTAVVDSAPVWTLGGPLTDSIAADDLWYRKLIFGKVYRNYTRYGSIPEIQEMIRRVLGIEVSFSVIAPMTVNFIGVQTNTPLWALRFLLKFTDTMYADQIPFPPYPETLSIEGIFFVPDPVFIPDTIGHGADVGKAGIRSNLTIA
jgi:hypothetical protein